MGLNKQTGNMFEFVTHTWNPIKGECPHDCVYCYMKRWGKQRPLRLDEKDLNTDLGIWNKIFVGSSTDMFRVPVEWTARVMEKARAHPLNTYLFLTKSPNRFPIWQSLMPPKVYLGATLETNRHHPDIYSRKSPPPLPLIRAAFLSEINYVSKFVSIEPVLDFDTDKFVELVRMIHPAFVAIGADSREKRTGTPKEPDKKKLLDLIGRLETFTTVVKKNNLRRLLK